MRSAMLHLVAGACLSAACFAFWSRAGAASPLRHLLVGVLGLAASGVALTLAGVGLYGPTLLFCLGAYICSGLAWLWLAGNEPPHRWSVGEIAIALFGFALLASSAWHCA